MRILFFSRLFYPHIGGVEKHVWEVGKRLIKKGHQVVIITERLKTKDIPVYLYPKTVLLAEAFGDMKIHRIPVGKDGWFKKFEIWIWLFRNLNLIKQADIIHCHDVFFWYLPFRLLFPKKPVYTTFHGYESYPISKKAIWQRKIAEVLSFGNICVGDFIQKWYGTKPTFVSYGGVDVANIKNQISNIKNKNSAVFVGRLDEQTGFLTYLKAFKLIKKKIPDFKLTVFGDGKFKNMIKKDVDLKGFSENAEREIRNYNFVFASRYLSILEAMAGKKLVFAIYDNPLKKDYLTMAPFTKFIIMADSAETLANKVFYYLNNPLKKQKIINNAFNWVKNQGFESLVDLYLKLWAKKQ